MKKTILAAAIAALCAGSASAWYFDGGLTGTTGPDGYSAYKLNLLVGQDDLAFEPSLTRYTSDGLDKTYSTFGLRGAVETEKYTVGAEAGMTPEVNDYSNKYVGADITFSLTPTSGGKARLAGPGSRGMARGGEGVTRVDVGAALKHTLHDQTVNAVERETTQTAATLFAGAKVLMLNLSASFTGYTYGDEDAAAHGTTPGHTFLTLARPRSSVNARVDLPSTLPMVTPFAGYTVTKYKGGSASAETDKSSAVLLGGYVDLNMVVANVTYQIFSYNKETDSFISVGAGLKF